ncbi:hypothetical protein ACSZMR_13540 [Aeromonas veronii]
MPKKPVTAGHEYKVTFGVKQTENINKAANTVNKTPRDFISDAAVKLAKKITKPQN